MACTTDSTTSLLSPELNKRTLPNVFQILEALETDTGCRKLHLAHRLENVACTLEGEETSAC